jgi:hypothetical protein
MFQDLDKTLEVLLRRELPSTLLEGVSISFATPDSEFPPAGAPLPALNLFLYDIRENNDLRNNEWYVERTADDKPFTRHRSPVRVECSYLITAWPSDASPNPPGDEHRLLGEVLKVLLRHPTIPEVLLQGSLQDSEPPLPTITIQPSQLQSIGDFWQAIGAKPKAALNYAVTIGIVPEPPVETEIRVIDKVLEFEAEVEAEP